MSGSDRRSTLIRSADQGTGDVMSVILAHQNSRFEPRWAASWLLVNRRRWHWICSDRPAAALRSLLRWLAIGTFSLLLLLIVIELVVLCVDPIRPSNARWGSPTVTATLSVDQPAPSLRRRVAFLPHP
jgi:hypothetical protein